MKENGIKTKENKGKLKKSKKIEEWRRTSDCKGKFNQFKKMEEYWKKLHKIKGNQRNEAKPKKSNKLKEKYCPKKSE